MTKALGASAVRYLLVGAGLFLLDSGIFFTLVKGLNWSPAPAQFVSRLTGAAAGFVAHRSITFQVHAGQGRYGSATQGAGYAVVTVGMLLLTPLLVQWFYALSGGRVLIAKLLTELVAVVCVYLGLRLVFSVRSA